MDGRRWVGAPVSRRGFRSARTQGAWTYGLPVVQVCPNPRCRRDFHRPSERCRFCGELLARPLGAAGEDVEDDQATALEPAGEPDPELDEADGGAPVLVLWARWIWVVARVVQRDRSDTWAAAQLLQAEIRQLQYEDMVTELVRESGRGGDGR